MGTTAYGGKGSKGRAANGDPSTGAASCRREQYTKATCQTHPPPPCKRPHVPYAPGVDIVGGGSPPSPPLQPLPMTITITIYPFD